MPDVSAIIVSYNTLGLTLATIRHLLASATNSGLSVETIVVDNASADGTAMVVRNRFPKVEVIELRENLGFAAANNMGLQRATAPYLLLLNSDLLLLGNALGKMMQFIKTHPRIGMVSCSLFYADGEHQDAAFHFPSALTTAIDLFPVHHCLRRSRLNGRYLPSDEPFQIDHPLGACMLVRREAYQETKGLDEGYFMYCEELDWCWRMRLAGWEVWSLPAARAVHYAGQSTRQSPGPMYEELFKSRRRFARRWYQPADYRTIDLTIRAGMAWKILATGWNWLRGRTSLDHARSSLATFLRIATADL